MFDATGRARDPFPAGAVVEGRWKIRRARLFFPVDDVASISRVSVPPSFETARVHAPWKLDPINSDVDQRVTRFPFSQFVECLNTNGPTCADCSRPVVAMTNSFMVIDRKSTRLNS